MGEFFFADFYFYSLLHSTSVRLHKDFLVHAYIGALPGQKAKISFFISYTKQMTKIDIHMYPHVAALANEIRSKIYSHW